MPVLQKKSENKELKENDKDKIKVKEKAYELAFKKDDEFKVLFTFNFELLESAHQQLYLSQDKMRLLEVCNKTTATIYRLELPNGVNSVDDLNGKFIKWIAETKINQFP